MPSAAPKLTRSSTFMPLPVTVRTAGSSTIYSQRRSCTT
jgi:hypothetical protein